jgi:hypothetical protein
VLAAIVKGGSLLSQSDANLIETWLDGGSVTFELLFDSKTMGESSGAFHTAVDGQGSTISLIHVSGYDQIIGGYNAASWNSINDWIYSTEGFIFNLTQSVKQDIAPPYSLAVYDCSIYGPIFGGGHDICVGISLNYGYVSHYNYGSNGINIMGDNSINQLSYDKIEVFKINNNGSPPPQ